MHLIGRILKIQFTPLLAHCHVACYGAFPQTQGYFLSNYSSSIFLQVIWDHSRHSSYAFNTCFFLSKIDCSYLVVQLCLRILLGLRRLLPFVKSVAKRDRGLGACALRKNSSRKFSNTVALISHEKIFHPLDTIYPPSNYLVSG